MAGPKKFLRNILGAVTEVFGVVVSAGAANDGDIPALDATGRLDNSVMPVGIGKDTKVMTTSEALAAGDLVNIWNSSGAKVRKADATTAGKEAWGFVLASATSGGTVEVFFEGANTQASGLTPGPLFLQTSAGAAGATVPSTAGNVVQSVGIAVSATEFNFERGMAITLA